MDVSKLSLALVSVALLCGTLMTSCYTYTSVVGKGAQGGEEVKQWNHYAINGLVPIDVSESKEMAGGTQNYEIEVKHSFINLVVSALTLGLYSPTTTKVKK